MEKKNHLRLIGDKQLSEIGRVKFNPSYFDPDKSDEEPEKDFYPMALSLSENLALYYTDLDFKNSHRNPEIEVPENIDFIAITFFDQFDINTFYNKYYNDFGLEGVNFQNFGREVLFAVADKEKFKNFIKDLNAFLSFGLEDNSEAEYSNLILYIKEFKLLTTNVIVEFEEDSLGSITSIDTINLPLLNLEDVILDSLEAYLNSINLEYTINKDYNKIEIFNATYAQVQTIASNFDIIQSITCSLTSIVRPSKFNTTQRAFGFEINNVVEELPLIGIIDTGISMATPLESITLQDQSFTLDGDPLIDEAGRGYPKCGHGTGVAGLAALGRENHLNEFQGSVNADAKLLSIKLSRSGSGFYSEQDILDLLYSVKTKYADIKIFVLTSCFKDFKLTNSNYSSYTYALDKFAYETDSLIFISIGNNDDAINENSHYDLSYFNKENTNLNTPADSMNNMTIGAAAEGLYSGTFLGISPSNEYPALFTRKSHINLSLLYPSVKLNKKLFKPDVIECGGDLGYYNPTTIDFMDNSAMSVLSANPAMGFIKETGTSYSAPLAANLAAKLLKVYPNLNSQTIKALIVNGASINNIRFPREASHLLNKTAGNGFVNIDNTLFSNDNSVTLILEDSIINESQNIYPINFPKYLIEDELGKKRGILKITATLCFSFEPVKNNQLSYCPIHMAFSIFKNHSSDQINAKNDEWDSKLKSNLSWSQNGRFKGKPIPYSNSQKIEFPVNLNELIDEDATFSLAVQARLTSQILKSEIDNYTKEYPFSIVLKIEETLRQPTSKLYDELIAINNLEVITEADAEGTLEV